MNPDTIDYTYIDPSSRDWNSRIDILCECKNLLPRVELCIHKITPCPDHRAVVMSVQGEGRSRGPGYWKLNVSVLNEELYREGIRDIIKETFLEYFDIHQIEKSMIWELLKIRVKEFSIKYCSVRKQKRVSNI